MYIALLGRQPALSVAELEVLYGSSNVQWFSGISATITSESFDINHLGGTQKAGRVIAELRGNWRQVGVEITKYYAAKWMHHDGKITLGISAYGFPESARDIQKTGLILKKKLREQGVSLRLIPNSEPALNTATSHHNKLGLNDTHVELLIVRAGDGRVIIAESVGAQNITAFAARDQARPKTDAFVGMLPPKLARMMVNMTGIQNGRILDPFCGTGVVLQEAALLGFDIYGTDLSDKMIDYSGVNLEWLNQTHRLSVVPKLAQADAMTAAWDQPISGIVCETYLGQPFSAPPSPAKLTEVRGNCNHIISTFLANLSKQIPSGTPLCIAVPAWKSKEGNFTHLPFLTDLDKLGYRHRELRLVNSNQLLYYRETQVVARELLLLEKA